MSSSGNAITIHATAVAWRDRAVLLCGKSGSGKSAVAVELLALGCQLIADDQVRLTKQGTTVVASCPPVISGMIEVRGIGLVNAIPAPPTPVSLVIDLDVTEDTRMPHTQTITQLGIELPLINRIAGAHFPAAILQILKAGRSER